MVKKRTWKFKKPTFKTIRLVERNKFSHRQLLIFILVFSCLGGYFIYKSLAASLPNVYIAQSQAGTADGSTCANAKAVSFFNTATNWGTNSTQIGPGTTVHLCGTIITDLTFQGSGTSGNPITLFFEPNAKLSQPVCGGCIGMNNRSFITVDGGTNGVLESNANGTTQANHSGMTAIDANPCSDCEIKNLTVGSLYTITSGDTFICASGCVVDNAGVRCIDFSGNNWKIHDNTFHDASWCLFEHGDDSNTRIYNNNIYNFDHGWIPGSASTGKLYFYNNHIHDMGLWDACNSGANCHHDGIHCYNIPGPDHYVGVYIYNNRWDGTLGTSATGWIFLEANTGSSCADSTSAFYIFNNIFSSSDQVSTNDYVGGCSSICAPTYTYNNTFSGPGPGHYGANQAGCGWGHDAFKNNVSGGCHRLVDSDAAGGATDYNAYASPDTGNCFPTFNCNFTQWQATGKDVHSVFALNGATGSNAIGAGTNLTSLCSGDLIPLCSDINGNARPTTGAWDAGAVQVSSVANVWVSTTGNDSTCVRNDSTKPCATFQKACTIAVGGDIVEIANGTYAPQLISSCSPTSSVTFQPATGATVNLNRGLNITGCSYDPLDNRTTYAGYGDSCGLRITASSNLTFKDLKLLDQWNVESGSNNISMVNIKAQRMKGGCLTNLSVIGGDYGPYDEGVSGHDSGGSHFIPEVGGCGANGVTIDGANFHDYSCDSSCLSSGAHPPDCVSFYGNGNGTLSGSVLVQHSKFVHCGGFDAWAKNTYNGSVWFSSITFRNNFFGKNDGGDPFEVEFASDNTSTVISNVHLEYNSFDHDDTGTSIAFCSSGCSFSNNTITGNVLSGLFGPPCGTPGITASYNVGLFFNSSCGPTNFVSTGALSEYISRTNVDFHLALSTSPAVDRGGTTCAGMTDIDGNARPQGSSCDAGAAEFSTGGSPSDTTPPTVSLSSPAGGSTVSGNVTVSANASDNVGVAGVQFKLDGNNLGSEDTTSPYSTTWNAATASNGSHTLTATARDAAGNTTISSTITVTVTGGTNVITIGEPNVLATGDSGNANLLLAQSTTLSQSAAIQSLSFYVTTAAGKLRLGIYDATGPGGGPGALKASTAEITPSSGWNTAVTTTTPTLSPGTYWLAYLPSDNNLAFLKASDASSSAKYYSYTYGALPATFSTAPTSTPSHWSFYATLNLGTGTTTPGDINHDGHVDIIDLSTLLSNWGTSNTSCDLNANGTVDIFDLSILLSHYGS